jgi:glycosyltransferase involved in cell wall biosynthesis/thioredoxin-like negative regulator of GroEL
MKFGRNKLKQLNRILKKDPHGYEPNLQMGLFYLQQEDISSAVPYMEKAAAVSKEAKIHFILANAHKTMNHPYESDSYFKKAISLEPNNFEYLHNYGQFLNSVNRIDEAVDVLKQATATQPQNYELWNDIGVLCYQQKKYEEAVQYLKRAITINDRYTVASVNIGYVYLAMDRLCDVQTILDGLSPLLSPDGEIAELQRQLEVAHNRRDVTSADVETKLTFSNQLFQIKPLRIIKSFGELKRFDATVLSIVVPIFNEEENIGPLYQKLTCVLCTLKQAYEIIFVDDGSTDGSREVLSKIAADDPNLKVIQFRRNYGQTAALNAGFKYAKGSVVVTLDGDLQNDPADIPKLLEKMAEGYDLVSGWRKDRKDTFISRKLPSFFANKIINKLIEGTGVQLHDFGCTLKAYKRGIVKNIHLYGEMHRFVPVFAAWLGVKVTEIPVNHFPRRAGVAKYNLSRVSRVIFDLIVVRFFSDYMTRPIQFFGKIGKKLTGWGMIAISFLIGLAIFTPVNVSINTILILAALLLFAVLQIVSMGLLGEIMIRSYFENQNKDYYVVEKIINDGR